MEPEQGSTFLNKIIGSGKPITTYGIKKYISEETLGGLILIASAVVAMIWANSSLYNWYHYIWHEVKFGFVFGQINTVKPVHHWINDGLMALFFFTIGLEIKREIIGGELSSMKKAALPLSAAIGGMLFPATIYAITIVNYPQYLSGWGIPMATDIAFALGLLSMLGKRVNINLKIFLMALAIADDIGAVMVIALFYTETIQLFELFTGGFFVGVLILANYLGVRRTTFFGLVGFLGVWLAFLFSGVHATIAGVLIAFTIPARTKITEQKYVDELCRLTDDFESAKKNSGKLLTEKQASVLEKIETLSEKAHTPLQKLEHSLHPVTIYFILPLFALANAGVRLEGNILDMVLHPISVAIFLGLFIGKSVGISLMSILAVKLKLADLPQGITWKHIYAVSFLAGIGFTMSIFISGLAFTEEYTIEIAKVGIFSASIISAIVGMVWLSRLGKKKVVEDSN
jgi:NhaA family Na+:H+ antiporter